MKKLILMTMIVLISTITYTASGYCYSCAPKQCLWDVQCDLGCWCYKGSYEYYGRCVSE